MTNENYMPESLYSNRALHLAHRDWVPKFSNPYNLVLTYADDISEKFVRTSYSAFIRKLSKRMLNTSYRDHGNLIGERGYIELTNKDRYHIHTMIDVHENWNDRLRPLVNKLWKHGLVSWVEKIPHGELAFVSKYNSKMRTKRTISGNYSDAYLVVDRVVERNCSANKT